VNKPKCFMELCAGTAALSVRLVGGKDAKPPVSRMGTKTGYADVILSVLGLYPGLGADSFVWCEPDDGVRGLLMAYCQPTVLREAAAILRGWKDEEPRTLWERLRAELKAGAAVDGAEGVAKLCMVIGSSFGGSADRFYGWFNPESDAAIARLGAGYIARLVAENGRDAKGRPLAKSGGHPDVMAPRLERMAERTYPPTFIARDGRAVTPEEVALMMVVKGNSVFGKDGFAATKTGSGADRRPHSVEDFAARLDDAPTWPPVTIVADGRAVTPEEVARFMVLWGMSIRNVGPDGSMDLHKMQGAPATETFGAIIPLWEPLAGRLEENGEIGWPPVTITDDARTITPNKLPEGVIVYMDPPYLDTTGYKHDLSREEVIRMARLWSDAGATVCISEQTTIPELIADGWHGVQISFARKGQKRTFSEQQDEYLTINCKPHFIPREPEPMFDDLKVVKKQKVKVVRVSQPTVTPIEPINQPVQTLNLFGGNDD